MAKKLPPNCGALLHKPLLYNPFQQSFLQAKRQRFCLNCKTIFVMNGETGAAVCSKCGVIHVNNRTAPRVFDTFGLFAGRRGGKTLVGAHGAREEAMVANSLGWAMGPTNPILHDSTLPTLCGLIHPDWVKHWDAELMNLDLINGARIAFRSLDDPDRAIGPGPDWGWFDEAARILPRAWDVFKPSLAEKAGIAIFTTTVLGYDWTYDRIERKALVEKEPGFWAARWRTIDNPMFASDPVLRNEVEKARRTMTPEWFAQEYLGERRNFTGSIYGELVERAYVRTDDAMRELIPEWPQISPTRQVMIGLDSGADHPFGAVLIVKTPKGLVIVDEYLQRMQANVVHLGAIHFKFKTSHYDGITWAANKNEAQLRLEFGLRGIGIVPAENKHEVGIQRVQSWLHTNQLFIAPNCTLTYEQMRKYRYADNYSKDGQKRAQEAVFKLDDELPDAIRYAIMAWPELPDAPAQVDESQKARFDAFSEKTRRELAIMKENREREKTDVLIPEAPGLAATVGDMFGVDGGNDDWSLTY